MNLTVHQSVTAELVPRGTDSAQHLSRGTQGGCPPVLDVGARVLSAACGALNYVLAVVLICAGAGIEAAGRALMDVVRGSDG